MKQLTPTSPHVIVMVGIPGAGKSTFATRFAETFKTPFINQFNLMRQNSLSTAQGEDIAKQMLDELIKTGKTILFESSITTKKDARTDMLRYIIKQGYRPLLVWVQTESLEAERRATKPFPGGSGLTIDEFAKAVDNFDTPHEKEGAIVISGKHTYATQIKTVLKQLSSARRDASLPKRRIAPAPRPNASNSAKGSTNAGDSRRRVW